MTFLLVLVLAAAPKNADAAPQKPALPAQAAVFVSSPDEAAAAKSEAELKAALQSASAPLVDVAAQFPAPARDQTGDGLVKEARQAFDDLDYEAAATKWNEALEFFTRHPEAANAMVLGDAHFFVGALALANGGKSQAKKAQEEFARALLNNPDLTCDPQTYGADAKKVFDKAHAEVNARPTAKLNVESTPAGADATVRGKKLGATPVDAPAVPTGRHLVLLSKTGYESTGLYADVEKDGGEARAELKAAPGYSALRDAATVAIGKGVAAKGALPDEARKLAEASKARFLVMSDGATAEAWDVETGNRLAGLSVMDDQLTDTAKQIAEFIKNPRPAIALADGAGGETAAGGPVYKQWWFWTAVGVVVVGGATAGAVAGATSSGGRPFNVVLGTP